MLPISWSLFMEWALPTLTLFMSMSTSTKTDILRFTIRNMSKAAAVIPMVFSRAVFRILRTATATAVSAAAAQVSLRHLSLYRMRTGAGQTWRSLCRCFRCFINRPLNFSSNVESSNVEVIAVFP